MNCKTLTSMCAVAALMMACAPQQPENQFSLKGTIGGADGQEIYLFYAPNDSVMVRDTVVITNGAFEFKGELNIPMATSTLFMGDARDWQNTKRCQIYLEPKVMTVAITDMDSFQKPVITGSFTQSEADTLNQQQGALREQILALNKQMQAETDKDKREALKEQTAPLQAQMSQLNVEFVKTHPNSLLAPQQMRLLMSRMSYQEIKDIYDSWTDYVKQYGDVEEIEKELAALANIQPGMPAPDIKKADVNGKEVSISSLKGKVVLLDFWASWCVPCRKSFPHVKALYNKYHSKGFEVFCVADNDSSEDKWREAIQKDGVEKFYHVLRGLVSGVDENGKHFFDRSNDVSDLYAVHYLPTKYLIDREGKIIGKMDTDEQLDAKLKEIFGF